MALRLVDRLKDPSLLKTAAFVAGSWVETGKAFDVLDPANGSVLTSVSTCGRNEVDQAVQGAAVAQRAWAGRTGKERSIVLRKWFELMNENVNDLSIILTAEAGKPLAEAKGELNYAASFFEWFGEEAKRSYGETIPATAPNRRLLVRAIAVAKSP